MDNTTDEQIALKVQSGDAGYFSLLFERYEKRITRYARKFFLGEDDIKDVVQNIFIKAYVNINSFDTKRKFSPWIYRIAHNELVNALKKKGKNTLPFINLDTFLPQGFWTNKIDQDIDRARAIEMATECMESLDFKYREPLYLHYFEDMDYKEISDVLQIPVSTVGVRIKRAKEAMRKICKDSKILYEYSK